MIDKKTADLIKMAMFKNAAWNEHCERMTALKDTLTDEQEIAVYDVLHCLEEAAIEEGYRRGFKDGTK